MTICPDRETLCRYLDGGVDEKTLAEIDQHLNECPRCLETLHTVATSTDAELRDLVKRGRFLEESAFQNAQGVVFQFAADSSNEHDVEIPAGAQLGNYRIVERVGRGGMGVVYKAVHSALDRTVAIKVIRFVDDARRISSAERFQREMKASGRLVHPNIVQATDAGVVGQTQYLAMEFVEGADLEMVVARTGPLSVHAACDAIRQAALGLSHAHSHGLVHRDVKPSNLMRTHAGIVKVLDLGLAVFRASTLAGSGEMSAAPDVAAKTTATGFAGTHGYMAPEQLADSHSVDHKADVYALGATLTYLLTGQAPRSEKQRVSQLGPAIAPPLLVFIKSMMASSPADRPTCDEVARFMEQWTKSTPSAKAGLPWMFKAGIFGAAAGVAILAMVIVPWLRSAKKDDSPNVAVNVADGPKSVEGNNPSTEKNSVKKVDDSNPSAKADVKNAPPPPPMPTSPPPLLTRSVDAAVAKKLQEDWARWLGRPSPVRTNSIGMEMVLIPPGEYLDEFGDRVVLMKPYEMCATETTREQFAKFQNDAKIRTALELNRKGGIFYRVDPVRLDRHLPPVLGPAVTWEEPGYAATWKDPVCQVTHHDTEHFCNWIRDKENLEYRLPSRFEWLWAARAGEASGDKDINKTKKSAWDHKNCRQPMPVASLAQNAWGLFDVAGNVSEWTSTIETNIESSRFPVHVQPAGARFRVVCGTNYSMTVPATIERRASMVYWGGSSGARLSRSLRNPYQRQ